VHSPGKDKREAILSTALTLFAERGFFGTPTSLISKEAGVATGTLFFYFRTKEDLIDEIYRNVKADAAQAMSRGLEKERSAGHKLRRLGINAVAWGIQNPAKMKFMEQFAHSPFVSTSAQDEGMSHFLFLKDIIYEGIRDGKIRETDPSLLFCMMASVLNGLVLRASATENPADREAIIEEGLDFVWNGMKA